MQKTSSTSALRLENEGIICGKTAENTFYGNLKKCCSRVNISTCDIKERFTIHTCDNKNRILLRYNSLPCGTECCSRMAARHEANV